MHVSLLLAVCKLLVTCFSSLIGKIPILQEDIPRPDEPEEPIPLPAEDIGPSYAALVQLVWQRAESVYGGTIPTMVRLAVETEVRWRDWQTLSGVQLAAASSKSADASLSWLSYQSYIRDSLEALQNATVSEIAAAEAEHNVPKSPKNMDAAPAGVPSKADSASSEELEEGEVSTLWRHDRF